MTDDYRVTSVGVTPAEDRVHRMRLYFIAMSIRVLCIVSLFWVRGWWILLAAAGAILLPYFAVMWANAVNQVHEGERPDAPTPLELPTASQMSGENHDSASAASSDGNAHTEPNRPADIVIDAPEYRRGTEAPE